MSSSQGAGRPDLSALRIDDRERSSGGERRVWRVLAVVVGGLAVVLGAVFALVDRKPVVEVASARAVGGGTSAALLNASGYVTPRRRATIAAKITARVVDVLIDEGVSVTKGQVLARLDDSDALRRLLAARTSRDATAALIANLEVNLANADRELKRQQDLEREGVTTVQALELARTASESLGAQIAAAREQVRAADAQIGVAQQDVDNCTVRAPFAGVVVSKDAQVGEMVSPISAGGGFTRTGIATIVDMDSIETEVDVNESYIARVVPGQRVEAVLDAYPDWRIPSKVRTVIPTADRQKATVKVRISFDKLDPRILPDMGVKVSFLAERAGRPGCAAGADPGSGAQAGRRQAGGLPRPRRRRRTPSRQRRRHPRERHRGAGGPFGGDQVVVAGPEDLRDGRRSS